MSARARLTEALMNPGLVGLGSEEADELIANFAHELAEEQRHEHNQVGGGCDLGVCHGESLPDLIDPFERPESSEEKRA